MYSYCGQSWHTSLLLAALRAASHRASLKLRIRLLRDLDFSLLQTRLDLSHQLRHFVAKHLVIDQVAKSVQQVLALFPFDLGKDHEVLRRFIEALTSYSSHVVEPGLLSLFQLINLLNHLVQLLANLLVKLSMIFILTFNFGLLVPHLDKLHRRGLEVLLKLAHVSTLTEEGLGGGPELVFDDLFAFKVGTLGARHELVAVILVADLKMVKRVEQCFDLLLALLDLAVELVTVALKLLFFLGCLDHVVGLRVFSLCLHLA